MSDSMEQDCLSLALKLADMAVSIQRENENLRMRPYIMDMGQQQREHDIEDGLVGPAPSNATQRKAELVEIIDKLFVNELGAEVIMIDAVWEFINRNYVSMDHPFWVKALEDRKVGIGAHGIRD